MVKFSSPFRVFVLREERCSTRAFSVVLPAGELAERVGRSRCARRVLAWWSRWCLAGGALAECTQSRQLRGADLAVVLAGKVLARVDLVVERGISSGLTAQLGEEGYEELSTEAEAALTTAQRTTLRESKKRDKKTLFLLYQGIDEATFEKISDATSSKETWEVLQCSMQGVDKAKKVKLQSLRAQYKVIKMQVSEKVGDYVTRLRTLTNEMKRNGETIDDVSFMEKLLRSMSKKFRHMVVAIEESKDLTLMTVDELVGSLQAHEYRMLQDDEESSGLGKALQTQLNFGESSGRGGQRGRGYQGRSRGRRGGRDQGRNQYHQKEEEQPQGWRQDAGGRGRGQGRGQGRGRGDMSQIQCYNCNKFGYMSYDCRASRKREEAKHYAEASNTGGRSDDVPNLHKS
ncbi:hypothetical protein KSP39_PZI020029 [Platanthera zijinensis]|uniref:CCHC-type domain-containing protein n=1 Tax=Platanthera zijinensis TaxID=2320716 RepID=A0AAP0FWV6_9ASPA